MTAATSRILSIATKLLIGFLALGFTPVLITSTVAYYRSAAAIRALAASELSAIRDLKKDMVQRYLAEREIHASVLAEDSMVMAALVQTRGLQRTGGAGSPASRQADVMVGAYLRNYAGQYGYRAAYLIAADGDIIYSTVGGEDTGTNLFTGPFSDTNFAQAVQRAGQASGSVLSDLAFYPPAGNLPQMFVVKAVRSISGDVQGYVALGMAPDGLERIMGLRTGLGETGETFLVGPDGRMRTRSYLVGEDTALRHQWDTPAIQRALNGETGEVDDVDYRREPVLTAFTPLDVGDLGWVVVAKIDQAEALRAAQQLLRSNLAVAGVVLVAVIVVALLMARSIGKPLQAVAAAATRISEGDLTLDEIRVRSGDEVGALASAFNAMMINLRDLIGRIRETSGQLLEAGRHLASAADQSARATSQIVSAIEGVAEGANRQASTAGDTVRAVEQLREAIEQIAAGAHDQARRVHDMTIVIEQMSQALQKMSGTAQQVAQGAAGDLEAARTGGAAVREAVEAMNRIRATVNDVAARVHDLGRQSQRIGEIVEMISGIADQTNLLALNAAIEAARAGEHGRGFAVVAEEVRHLAEQSAESTRQIAALIETIQAGVKQVVEAVRVGTQEVEQGAQLAGKAGDALEKIVLGIQRSSERAQEIAAAAQRVARDSAQVNASVAEVASVTEEHTAATEEMSSSSEQVADAIEQVSSISEETAAAAEEVAASVEEVNTASEEMRRSIASLTEMAERLEELVGRFRLR